MFGVMFAPRPELIAAELVRVCRPGGRIALANWTPDGFIGQMFKIHAKYVPSPPNMPSPLKWGDKETVRDRLGDRVANLQLTQQICPFKYDFLPAEVVEFFRTYYGPTQRAFDALDKSDRAALRMDLERLWFDRNRAGDNTTYVEGEYLEVIATKN
jgi:SAM-dependent methyltransferase